MKFDNVLKICKQKRKFIVFRENPKVQWLGDDIAVYLASNYPQFTPEYLTAAASLKPDEVTACLFKNIDFPDLIDSSDDMEDENFLDISEITINFPKGEYTPVFTSKGIRFIKTEYFSPFQKDDEITLFERETPHGDMYFVIKVGMFVRAIIRAQYDYLDVAAVAYLEKIASKAQLARKIMEDEEEEIDSLD